MFRLPVRAERPAVTRRALAVAGAVLVLLASACGSTIDQSQLASLQGDPAGIQGGLGLVPDVSPGVTTGPGATPGGVPGGNVPGGVPTIPPGGDPFLPGAPAIGVDAKTIKVGVVYASDNANEVIGAGEVTTGDERHQNQVVIEDLNRRGGIAGRTVVPVWASVSDYSAETYEQQYQGVCDTFTKDNQVYAAMSGQIESFIACMERAGSATVYSGLGWLDARVFQRYPHYVEVDTFNLNRLAEATVEGMWDLG